MSITTAPPGGPVRTEAPAEPEPQRTSPPLVAPEPPRRRIGLRLLLACLAVLIASAATTVVFGLNEVHRLTAALNQNPALKLAPGELAPAGFGGPQTLLLVGNDQRAHTTTQPVLPHSNEMLLVRIDPSKPWISMMSIPRELWVTIYPPNQPAVTTRFNYAYTAGGIPLLVSTIKRVIGLSVNHVIVIDFNQFKAAVNDIGCVYSTVDRRYYHINTATSEQYQEINLQPGYQDLCGTQALEFVSYRHGDTSLIRDSRDQSFLLSVKNQYGPTLVDNIHKFEQIFGRTVETDPSLHTTDGILNLLGTLISSAGRPVRQVQFQATLLPTFDTASPQQIAASVHSFLFGGGAPPKHSTASLARAVHHPRGKAHLPLAAATPAERSQARAAARDVGFPLEFPSVQDAGGAGAPIDIRDYLIHAPGGAAYPIFVEVFTNGLLGQYYDVQGTTWTTAPLFDSPNQTVAVGRRTYELFYVGSRLETVAWFEHGAVYWVHNTLLDSISNGEMLAIAEQTTAVQAARSGPHQPYVRLTVAKAPVRTSPESQVSRFQTVGSLGGLIALAIVPLLAIPVVIRRRQLVALRHRLQASSERAVRLQATVLGFGIPQPDGGLASGAPISVYRRSRMTWRHGALVGAGVLVLAAGAALGAERLLVGSGKAAAAHTVKRAPRPVGPTIPIAVLNATAVNGAAGRLARQLQDRKVVVAVIGNLDQSRPPGTVILYAPGARAQAARLARVLAARDPTIAPFDPVAHAAAGPSIKLAVVIA